MKHFFSLFSILFSFINIACAQMSSIEVVNPFADMDVAQNKVITYVNGLPRNGTVKYINWVSVDQICNNGQISFLLPDENNGQPVVFDLTGADFTSADEYSLYGRGELGNIAIYITPQGIGGTIDLVNKVYLAFPLGGTKGTLIERLMDESDRSVCGTDVSKKILEENYCNKDCGPSVLDVLALVTPEARQWVTDTWGWIGDWFLYVETHNINGALINSAITDKRVRVKIIDYAPDFAHTTEVYTDLVELKNSEAVKQLSFQNGADITMLLTNSDYGDITGAIPYEQGDPTSINKVGIVEVSHVGIISYTFAHEVAHHFGCGHSEPYTLSCANGKFMEIGKNTIMGTGLPPIAIAPPYTRIQHFSNPDVLFGGEPTGDYAIRDNAAQIRGAFCEVANNLPEKFGVSISKTSTGPICTGETHTFAANLFEGNCIDMATLEYHNCSDPPYQYEWSVSSSPAFTNSQSAGNSAVATITLPFCPVYIRVSVSSNNGLAAVSSMLYGCSPGVVCNGMSDNPLDRNNQSVDPNYCKIQCSPNPACDQMKVTFNALGTTAKLTITDLMGKVRHIENIRESTVDEINLDVSALDPGVWLLQIEGDKTKQNAFFVILRR